MTCLFCVISLMSSISKTALFAFLIHFQDEIFSTQIFPSFVSSLVDRKKKSFSTFFSMS
jgi:cellobiose-specific phosphotransferase system component IIA